MNDITQHKRIQESLLTPPERRVLRWLAAHTPAWVLPDHLTALGSVGAVSVCLGFALSGFQAAFLWLAVAGFVINWYGDSLDGTLARYRKRERPRYGFFLDHTMDVIAEILMFAGIGLSPYANLTLALWALISYLAISQLTYINMIVSGDFRLSGGKIGPTEVRVIGIGAAIALYFFGCPTLTVPLLGLVTWFDLLLVALTLFFFGLYVVIGRQLAVGLARLEP